MDWVHDTGQCGQGLEVMWGLLQQFHIYIGRFNIDVKHTSTLVKTPIDVLRKYVLTVLLLAKTKRSGVQLKQNICKSKTKMARQ